MINLTIVTPEGKKLEQDCLSVNLPGIMGELGVLPGHAPCLAELVPGLVSYEKPDKQIASINLGAGFAQIENERVNIICEEN